MKMVEGRIAFVGSLLSDSADIVAGPRPQLLPGGKRTSQVPGTIVLAAMTETLMRGAPLKDARWPVSLVWSVAWCVVALTLMPPRRPRLAALAATGVIFISILGTGVLHAIAGFVLPAGLLLGCLLICCAHSLVSSHIQTTKALFVEEAENQRVRSEMRTARLTQEMFLPKTMPSLEGYDIWGENIPSLEVSGDYFDVIERTGSESMVITMADVSGKGLPASLLMSNVQAGLHVQCFQKEFDLLATVRYLNRLIHENSDTGSFITMFIGVIQKDTGVLRYVCAGHDPGILVMEEGSIQELGVGGMILGVMADAPYTIGEVQLEQDSLLCLYTDGVTEARNPADEEFEVKRLVEILTAHRSNGAREVGQAILDSVESFTTRQSQADDITVLLLKVGS
jgi:hypothetical protein